MLWQILIVTHPQRHEFLGQLLSLLEPQIAALGVNKFDKVDVLIHVQYPPNPGVIGDTRERVRRESQGEYISFIDDDDLIALDYISRVLPLLDGVDIIGWEQEVWIDKKKMPQRDLHTISVPGWFNDAKAFHRDLSHLQPIRREIALAAPMEGGYGEDQRWADRMRTLGVVKTEHYIDAIMYYYLCRTVKNDARDAHDPWRLEMIERLRAETQTPANR